MGSAREYAVIDPAIGKIDRRIFSEQKVCDDEMEKIFGRAWLMIGHESLVPGPDDFFHTYMGEDPVILTRDGEGRLHALLNMCRHRGNRVVRCDDGNAKRFMCTYHGWTYRNDGALEHVPGESEAYYDALDRPSLGLIEARVETYAGIVFATWAKDAPSLEAYLGDARWYLDTVFNRRDGGMQALGPMKWLEPVNWKTLVDNCSDNYHVPTSHLSSARVQTRYLGRPRLSHVPRRELHRELTPQGDLAILEEDRRHLEMRVARLETGMAWAEDPPSRTRHLIGNLEAALLENGEVEAKTAFLVYRSHLETDHQLLSGCREDVLRKVEGGWKIARRTIVLDANVLLDKNLSVFL